MTDDEPGVSVGFKGSFDTMDISILNSIKSCSSYRKDVCVFPVSLASYIKFFDESKNSYLIVESFPDIFFPFHKSII